jgi:hypothetical protein
LEIGRRFLLAPPSPQLEQYRYVLDGELNYNRNGKLTKGMLGYFPKA